MLLRVIVQGISLVSLDVTRVHADWSGVQQHSEEIGRAAVDLLFSKLQAGERGIPQLPRTLQVHGHWHDGQTLRRPLQAGGRLGRARTPPCPSLP